MSGSSEFFQPFSPSPPPPGGFSAPPGPVGPPTEEMKRSTVLAVLEVAKLRRNSALAWVVTWAIFLTLVVLDFATVGALNQGNDVAVALDLLIPALAFAFLVPGGVSILFGSLSSLRWGETFRDLVGNPTRLGMAWLPGIRASKRSWNIGRQFLWGSWILGAFTATAFLFGLDSIDSIDSSYAGAVDGLLITLLLTFLVLRAFHHYFFARSVAQADEALVSTLPPGYWKRNELWWSLATFTLPLDPVVLFLISFLASGALLLTGSGEYATIVGAVAIGGTISMGAGGLLAYGYTELIQATRLSLRIPVDSQGRAVSMIPPEWSN